MLLVAIQFSGWISFTAGAFYPLSCGWMRGWPPSFVREDAFALGIYWES